MRISASDFILGVVPSTGVWVHMTGSTILDATPLVQVFPEIGKALKSKAHRDELAVGDKDYGRGVAAAVGLVNLIRWLFGKTSSCYADAFWQLLVWLAIMVVGSTALSEASDDPLDFPGRVLPQGRSQTVA